MSDVTARDKRKLLLYGLGLPDEIAKELVPKKRDVVLTRKRKKQATFLKSYIESGGMVGKSAEAAGVETATVRYWAKNDPVFEEAYENAKFDTLSVIEDEIIRRGVHGYQRPVFYKGKLMDHATEYDSNLIIFRAKKLDPSYRDNQQTNIGIMGEEIKISFVDPKEEKPLLGSKRN